MFDHVTFRVSDLSLTVFRLGPALAALEINQSTNTDSWAVWGNLAITREDKEHPHTHRVHVALIAPSHAHVDHFWKAGTDAGLIDDGPAGPRPDYADDYYAAFLTDEAGNSFEAVHRDGPRPRGHIDHVALRVADADASAGFYSTIAPAANLTLRRHSAERASFAIGESDGSLILITGEPSQNLHLAFTGDDKAARRFHADAIAAGYRSNGEPGERSAYHAGYYAAYALDPDNNNVEVVNHNHHR